MAKAATKQAQQPPSKDAPTNAVQEGEAIVADVEGAPAADRPAPRRAPGQKEVIPFEWKLCGYSVDGHTLTLFKSVEREDCEAQLARHEAEGYYEGVKIYKLDETVPPSPKAKKLRAASKKNKHDAGATQHDGPAVRKSGKAAQSVIQTAMGKLIDGRISVRRKKGAAGNAADKASNVRSARRSARKGDAATEVKGKSTRRSASAATADKATEKKSTTRAPSQKSSSKSASSAATKKKTTSRSATSTKKKTSTTRKKRKR